MSTNKLCIIEGCYTIASFNHRGINSREFCAKHKTEDMVNVRYKLCAFSNCNNKQKVDNLCTYHHNAIYNYDTSYDDMIYEYNTIYSIANILLSLHTKKIEF